MSAHQRHRGQHAQDTHLFHANQLPTLNQAVADLSWLQSRGYGENASLKLVGDRYRLKRRQRKAILRAACTDLQKSHRASHHISPNALAEATVWIDGYNLLITTEAALSGGIILQCRDGALRDIASVHGTYRKVEETLPALQIIGEALQNLQVAHVRWLLDAPISNSGRLKGIIMDLATEQNFNWEVDLSNNPDKLLVGEGNFIPISSDSWVLDHARNWYNLNRHIIQQILHAPITILNGEPDN